MRVGIGYDVHKLVKERDLIIGGITIPYEKGLLGHSDADVLIHAIIDAILGAIGEGDIGLHFPDHDDTYKNISSKILLKKTVDLMELKGYSIVNLDCVIIAQSPKLRPYINGMEKELSKILNINVSRLNIKSTTTEKLGFEGRGEGIAAECIVLLDNEIQK
jgi:2-C-methyl-D-erythritol 2,4-cyclodiphosphate synthase